MLVATRKMQVFDRVLLPGDPIPFLERWDKCSLQSNINLGWIKEVSEPEPVVTQSSVEPPQEASAVTTEPEPAKIPEKPVLACECGRKGFKSQRALSVHKRSHRS